MLAIVIVNNDLTVPSTNDPKFHQQVKKNVVYIHTHTHMMKYYSVIKMNAILPSAAACMYLEGIMLSKVSQRKTNTI